MWSILKVCFRYMHMMHQSEVFSQISAKQLTDSIKHQYVTLNVDRGLENDSVGQKSRKQRKKKQTVASKSPSSPSHQVHQENLYMRSITYNINKRETSEVICASHIDRLSMSLWWMEKGLRLNNPETSPPPLPAHAHPLLGVSWAPRSILESRQVSCESGSVVSEVLREL